MIVVGTNGRPDSRAAVLWAADEACRRPTPLRVVYALSMPAVLVTPIGDAGPLPEEVLHSAHEVADLAAQVARDRGVGEVQTRVELGSPAAVIIRESAEVDLVVLGSRGRGDVATAVLGSVMVTVTSHAKCPVVVVRPGVMAHLDENHAVVVGIDGSHHSDHAVAFAADMASRAGAPLVVLSAWHLPLSDSLGVAWSLTGTGDNRIRAEALAREPVDGMVQKVRATHPQVLVTGRVVEGDAGAVLAQASRRSGLVVVGSRGVGGFRGLLLGSVSHHVVHDATCPVAVVR